MRLVHEHAEDDYKPWAEFDLDKGKKYYDFSQVRTKIEEFTDKVAGKNKGIVADPILLTIHSSNCPDLTLVDLPGITRIPMSGSD
jgi:replication fork clamp-binding protein CrfC